MKSVVGSCSQCSFQYGYDHDDNNYSSSSLALSTSLYVQIDVSTLSIQQITKICQNYVKYEEAIDSLHSYNRRENKCNQCRSNKLAVGDEGCTNKQRNQRIANCQSLDELVSCMNPKHDVQYKLDLRRVNSIEFRQHTSSKDKTTVTNWIRFCTAFVLNSARLRSPMALKSTTSIEEEFDLLFEYVVKDRAIRNYYRERRDGVNKEEEDERLRIQMMLDEGRAMKNDTAAGNCSDDDSMSISASSSEGEIK